MNPNSIESGIETYIIERQQCHGRKMDDMAKMDTQNEGKNSVLTTNK